MSDVAPESSSSQPQRRLSARPSRAVVEGGARGVAGIIAAALAIALIVGSTVVAEPRVRSDIPFAEITPVPAAKQRLCAGPVLRLGGSSGDQATVATSAGRPSVVSAAGADEAKRTPLGATDNVAGVAPESLTLPPRSSESSGTSVLAGAQSESVASGTFSGFAADECLEASGVAWLAAGSTTVGRTSLISLSNPSSVDASVDLSFWGPTGTFSAPGSTGIIVPPGAQRVYPLAGFAPGVAQAVVRVESRGGPIVATIHESIVRTLEAGGVDIVGPTVAPATTVQIPGLIIRGADAVTAAQAALGFDDLQTVVRLLAPGPDAARATISIVPSGKFAPPSDVRVVAPPAVPITFTVDLEPGRVQDVPLPGLVDGEYSIAVTSVIPIVASARASTITADGSTDFAWLSAATPLENEALVTVPEGPGPTLQLSNLTDSNTTATVTDVSTDTATEIKVPAGASITLPLAPGAVLALAGMHGLVAAIGFAGPGALASYPLSVPAANSTPVRVYR